MLHICMHHTDKPAVFLMWLFLSRVSHHIKVSFHVSCEAECSHDVMNLIHPLMQHIRKDNIEVANFEHKKRHFVKYIFFMIL